MKTLNTNKIEEEITNQLVNQLAESIDRKILRDLFNLGMEEKYGKKFWDKYAKYIAEKNNLIFVDGEYDFMESCNYFISAENFMKEVLAERLKLLK